MFENIDISDSSKEEIERAVSSGRLSHAVILEGGKSGASLAAAREIAMSLVCTGENKPCRVCPACRKVIAESHPDVHFLIKDKKSTAIKVDEIRELRKKAKLLANDGDRSVFIIHEAQYMNPQAQNALLKIFEEPAPFITFILTCCSRSALLETIVSRATSYFLSAEEDDFFVSEENAAALETACELVRALCRETEFDFLLKTAPFQKDKELFKNTLTALSCIFRDAAIYKNKKDAALLSKKENEAALLSGSFTENQILRFFESTLLLSQEAVSSANYNLLTTRLCSVFYSIKIN